jgi:hypothetical protein
MRRLLRLLDGTPGRQTWKVLSWGFLAYFWSLINDAPLNVDSVLGMSGYLFMEVLLNLLSLLCFWLAAREGAKGGADSRLSSRVLLWTLLAFLWSSADDIPLVAFWLEPLRSGFWYPFDVAIHAVSLIFFYLAVRRSPSTLPASGEQTEGTKGTPRPEIAP